MTGPSAVRLGPICAAELTRVEQPAGTTADRVGDRGEPIGSGLLPAVLLMVVGLFGLSIATLLSNAAPGQFVVVSSPFAGRFEPIRLIAAADGAMVAPGGFENIVIAHSDRPDFSNDLRHAGAWLVFPAPRFLGCGESSPTGATL